MSLRDPRRPDGRRALSPFSRQLACALAIFAFGAPAEAAPTRVDGPYQAGAAQLTVKVGTWGDDCGPKPTNHSEPGGAARVSQEGSAVLIALPDRSLRSDTCWTPNPAVRVASAKASGDSYRVDCKTQPTDAKKETGTYVMSVAADGAISLSEDSNYDWQLKTSHCVASVKRVQKLTPGQAPAPQPATPAPAPKPAACVPGALAKLRLKPAEARVAPGKRVCFQVVGVDAAGCALKSAPAHGALTLGSSSGGARGSVNGMCFRADEGTSVASASVRVNVQSQSLRAEAVIRVLPPDLAAITADDAEATESELDDSAGSEGVFDAGVRAVVAGTGGHPWLAAVLLVFAVGLIAFGVRRRRKVARESAEFGVEPLRSRKQSAPAAIGAEAWLCPRCRRGYPAGTSRCTVDGDAPIPYAEYKRRVDQAEASRAGTVCPGCGTALAADAAFCGVCGRPRAANPS